MASTRRDETSRRLAAARAGDRDAFAALVGECRAALEAAVRARLGPYLRRKFEAQDVVQETLFRALDSVGRFVGDDIDSFRSWLRGIADHVLLYWAREHQRKDQLPLLAEPAAKRTSCSAALRRGERFERLAQAIGRLTPEQRETILLARVEGLSMREIGKRMGRSPEAVRQLLWRALQKLRGILGETESFGLPRDRGLIERADADGGQP